MPTLTFWCEFASTYSYLSAMRVEDASARAGVALVWRPFLLGPIFQAQGWATSPFNLYEAKGRNMWRDLARKAAQRGLPPVVRPEPFPQNSLLAARVATLGAGAPWGPAFTRAVFTAQFARGADISDPALIAALLDELGQSGAELVAQARGDQTVKDALRRATEAAQDAGLYGAPSFTTEDGELFWGDDRLEDALAWARGEGRL